MRLSLTKMLERINRNYGDTTIIGLTETTYLQKTMLGVIDDNPSTSTHQ